MMKNDIEFRRELEERIKIPHWKRYGEPFQYTVRRILLNKAENKCVRCRNNSELVIHHTKNHVTSFDDLIVLCRKCHGIITKSTHARQKNKKGGIR